MATTTNAGNIMLGRGKVYFDRLDASGNPTGERFLGNVTEFAVQTTDETREKFSSAEAAAPLMKRVVVRRTPEFSVTMDEYSTENLALITMGTTSEYLQAVAVDEVQVNSLAYLGRYIKLDHRNLTAVDIVEPTGGGVDWIEDTDWSANAADLVSGRIYIIPGGNIPDGDGVDITYDAPAIVAGSGLEMVQAAKSSVIEGMIRYIGDPASGPTWEVEVWKVSISPDGSMGLIGDDFGEFKITGAVLDDAANHATEPYYRMVKVADGT